MSIRILVVAAVGVLSGCAVNSDCAFGVIPQSDPSQPARCRSQPEYNAAREELRQSHDGASTTSGRQSWSAETKDRIEAVGDK
jgi:hypothetical protein